MSDTVNNKLAIIILAAGSSSRLGQAKQLVNNNNISLIQQSVKLALSLSDKVSCVLGHQAELFSGQIDNLNIVIHFNENWLIGMGSSIALGVKNLNNELDGVLILLCDQWALTKTDLQILINNWQQQPNKIIASCYKNKQDGSTVIGSPVIFPSSYFKHLEKLQSTGAQSLLKNNDQVIPIEINNAMFDLDTPEDLKEFQKQTKYQKIYQEK